ncbi:polysaccharide biosynthesis protein [Clostridium estertheticum]|uniref:putative polysaccharide biosynthesis protein n=1 Tax=Clostridium estertheticum TaxID=238834 RepID=UPI001CF438C8|nr:polysaccharide biosynthesis protein [Clostridium estertheticum]MCB2307256.1 polysaccharide biosynthesis protein [Clostridium estertheticum]MCB2344905.1 polysaccharide biosynthesis protein [Clostridium estertheticum]MCB2349931.1 polysaccharide biosynthesis protein [Clostridium estertheticum]WAG48148.1 polysaccharide biosynthesis protein [Clostridium estertheticum]
MKKQSTSKGFAILSSAAIAVKLLSIIYMPFLLSIIGGSRPYAIYGVAYQIYAFIYVLTNTGIPSSISKLISEFVAVGNYRSAKKTFRISRLLLCILGIVMAFTMFCVSGPLTIYMNYGEAKYSVMALCPAIVFTSVASAYKGYFQGIRNMKPTAISQVLEGILNTVLSLLFAAIFIRYGVAAGCVGATMGTTLGALASAIYLIVIYEKNKDFKVCNFDNNKKNLNHTNKQVIRRILKYSIPITLSIGIISAGTVIDSYNITSRLIAGGYLKDNAQSLYGMYLKYTTLINMPITIISALAVAVLPAISTAVALKDKQLVANKINFAFRISLLIVIPAAVGFSLLGKPIYELLHLSDGYKIMIFGSVIVIFSALIQIQTTILQGIGRLYAVICYSVLGLIMKYIVNYILVAIPSVNIYGAIIGSTVGFGVPIILNILYILKIVKIKINFKAYIYKPLVSSIFMAAVVYASYNILSYILGFIFKGYFNNAISVLIAIALGMLAYFYAMVLNKGITNDELDTILSKIKRFIPNKKNNTFKYHN